MVSVLNPSLTITNSTSFSVCPFPSYRAHPLSSLFARYLKDRKGKSASSQPVDPFTSMRPVFEFAFSRPDALFPNGARDTRRASGGVGGGRSTSATSATSARRSSFGVSVAQALDEMCTCGRRRAEQKSRAGGKVRGEQGMGEDEHAVLKRRHYGNAWDAREEDEEEEEEEEEEEGGENALAAAAAAAEKEDGELGSKRQRTGGEEDSKKCRKGAAGKVEKTKKKTQKGGKGATGSNGGAGGNTKKKRSREELDDGVSEANEEGMEPPCAACTYRESGAMQHGQHTPHAANHAADCQACGMGGSAVAAGDLVVRILRCGFCPNVYHPACVTPVLTKSRRIVVADRKDWVCPKCIAGASKTREEKKRTEKRREEGVNEPNLS